MSRKLSVVSAAEQTLLKRALGGVFDKYKDGDGISSSALTTFAADCGVVGSGKGKLGAGDVGLIFEQVKLGKRTELDFERFQEAVRKIAVGTG